jgi:hypothetical protein
VVEVVELLKLVKQDQEVLEVEVEQAHQMQLQELL